MITVTFYVACSLDGCIASGRRRHRLAVRFPRRWRGLRILEVLPVNRLDDHGQHDLRAGSQLRGLALWRQTVLGHEPPAAPGCAVGDRHHQSQPTGGSLRYRGPWARTSVDGGRRKPCGSISSPESDRRIPDHGSPGHPRRRHSTFPRLRSDTTPADGLGHEAWRRRRVASLQSFRGWLRTPEKECREERGAGSLIRSLKADVQG